MKPGPKRTKKTAPPKKKSTESIKTITSHKSRTKKNTVPKKKSKGRPKYIPSEEHFETATIGAKKGLNEEQIAKSIGISYRCFKNNKSLFLPALKKGRDMSDDRFCQTAEMTLMKKIKGYEWHEKTTITKSIKGADGKIIIGVKNTEEKDVIKHVPPSDTLLMFYLVNRTPERWRSINRDPAGKDENRGKIAQFFDDMRSGYKKRLGENGPNT